METARVMSSGTASRLGSCGGDVDQLPLTSHAIPRARRDDSLELTGVHPHLLARPIDGNTWLDVLQRNCKGIGYKFHSSTPTPVPIKALDRCDEETKPKIPAPQQPVCPMLPTKPQSHLPSAMARRNERERKRVRLVNHGFATLRQYLPQGRSKKKLSKMETLRSAIAYIKQLQMLLDPPDAANAMVADDRWAATTHTDASSSANPPTGHLVNWDDSVMWTLQRSPGSTGSSPQTSLSPEVELIDFTAFS